jgi:hypothetical protein
MIEISTVELSLSMGGCGFTAMHAVGSLFPIGATVTKLSSARHPGTPKKTPGIAGRFDLLLVDLLGGCHSR